MEDYYVVEFIVGDFDVFFDQVVEYYCVVEWIFEVDYVIGVVVVWQVQFMCGVVVMWFFLVGYCGFVYCIQFFFGFVGVIGFFVGNQLFGYCFVMGDVVGLVDWIFVVVQIQLVYCFQDCVDGVLGVVFVVGVFDVQYEFVVLVMGFQLVV